MAEVGPNPQDEAERIAWLSQRIAFHSDLYYNQAQSQITDVEFDRLWDELKALDPNHIQLDIVGSDVDPGTVKVDHMFAMPLTRHRCCNTSWEDRCVLRFAFLV